MFDFFPQDNKIVKNINLDYLSVVNPNEEET